MDFNKVSIVNNNVLLKKVVGEAVTKNNTTIILDTKPTVLCEIIAFDGESQMKDILSSTSLAVVYQHSGTEVYVEGDESSYIMVKDEDILIFKMNGLKDLMSQNRVLVDEKPQNEEEVEIYVDDTNEKNRGVVVLSGVEWLREGDEIGYPKYAGVYVSIPDEGIRRVLSSKEIFFKF